MKFCNSIYKTLLYIAVENNSFDIVKYLLSDPNINVNIKSV